MAEATIRAKIKSELEEITEIGTVCDREGADPGWKPSPNQQSIFCVISDSPGITETYVGIGGDTHRTHNYELRLYYPYSYDANSKAHFKRVIELVADKFRDNTRLDATCQHCGPVTMAAAGDQFMMYQDALCHFASLRFPVTERK